MIWIYRLLFLLLGIGVVFALTFIALTLWGWEKVWERTVGPPDLGPVVFDGLRKTKKPNQALVCPKGLCHESHVDQTSPVYALSSSKLAETLLTSLEVERDLERVDDRSDPLNLRFVQRTKLMRYPDTIRVQIIPVDDNNSTLAIYSQSQIGRSDLGVNLKRVQRWLKRLSEFEANSNG